MTRPRTTHIWLRCRRCTRTIYGPHITQHCTPCIDAGLAVGYEPVDGEVSGT